MTITDGAVSANTMNIRTARQEAAFIAIEEHSDAAGRLEAVYENYVRSAAVLYGELCRCDRLEMFADFVRTEWTLALPSLRTLIDSAVIAGTDLDPHLVTHGA